MTFIQKLKAIEDEIDKGSSVEELKKLRRKLYQIDNCELSQTEWSLKKELLTCIKDFLS